jgi:hypothetical protein
VRPTDAQARRKNLRNLALAGMIALLVYAATNPFVIRNALAAPESLKSNLSNSTDMYAGQQRRAFDGLLRCLELLPECASVVTVCLGALCLIAFIVLRKRGVLVAAAAPLAMFIVAMGLAAGKPAEFGRFLLLPALLLCITSALAMGVISSRRPAAAVFIIGAAVFSGKAPAYLAAFVNDVRTRTETRHLAAEYLAAQPESADAVAVIQEPAPYAVPPLDFAHTRVKLLPPQRPATVAKDELPLYLVFTADDARAHASAWWRDYYAPAAQFGNLARPARITWADKPVFVFSRKP